MQSLKLYSRYAIDNYSDHIFILQIFAECASSGIFIFVQSAFITLTRTYTLYFMYTRIMENFIREGELHLLMTESPCDVLICCKDQKLKAHKLMLYIVSPVLHELLIEDSSETTVLIFPDVNGSTMSLVLSFIYNGNVTVPSPILPEFLSIVTLLKLQVDHEYFESNINASKKDVLQTSLSKNGGEESYLLNFYSQQNTCINNLKCEKTTKKSLREVPNLMPIASLKTNGNGMRKTLYNKVFPSPWCPRIVPLHADPRENCTVFNKELAQLTIYNNYSDNLKNSIKTEIIKENLSEDVKSNVFVDNNEEVGKKVIKGQTDEKQKPYKCIDCGKSFSQLRNYKYHRSIHEGTKEFSARCQECGKIFNDKGYLSSHMKIHRDRKEYACPNCPKRFNQRVAYNMHMRIHTGLKPHECPTCGKSFSRKMLLKQHQRVHTGERPYSCPECGKSFADRSNMSLHARLHSGVKPYVCSLCPKSFTKKHHLKTHMNFHTGLKPYSCEKCGLAFSQSSNMRTHYKKCVLKPPETSKLLQDLSITSTELTTASLKRANDISKLNAFITITKDEANRQAEESLYRYKARKQLSELDGITIAIKDNFCTSNIKTTCASKMLENFKPSYNATVYDRLKQVGAVLIGKCNLDEFAMGSGTVDSIYGPSKNMWSFSDDFFITGGSSGGCAVAVATGACFAAIGSDTGGSTRVPSSYCGLVGLKPTYGLVSRLGLIPLVNSMDVPGILTRSIDDCVSILNAIAGPDPKDSTCFTKPYRKIVLPSGDKLSIKGLKVGIPVEYYCNGLSNEVLQTWNEVALMLEDNGAILKQVSLPNTNYSIVCYSILNTCEVASNMARYDGIEFGLRADENASTEKLYATSRSLGFNEVVRNRILIGNYFLLNRNYDKYFNQALKVRRLILNDFDKAWEEVQVLLTPTTLTTAPRYKDYISKTNRDQCAIQDFCTQPANMAGIPVVSLPIKLSNDGMPLSLQIMGRSLSEPMVLALAKFIESNVKFPQFLTLNNNKLSF
ncbi:hypothetical protein FQR65_LT11400 [Abscondita terminalis]|nr:hypothetical protein FQR65_LT11400 [Abscondita terminalis]